MSGSVDCDATGRWAWENKASETSSLAALDKLELMLDPEANMDALHLLSSERDDIELLEQALRQGRLNSSGSSLGMSGICSGLKLRQSLPTSPPSCAAALERNSSVMPGKKFGVGSGRRDIMDEQARGQASTPAAGGAASAVGIKPRYYAHALFVMGILFLVGVFVFIVNNGLVMVEVASRAHTLAGLRPWYPDPDDWPQLHSEFKLHEARQEQRQGVGLESNEGKSTHPQDAVFQDFKSFSVKRPSNTSEALAEESI